MLLGGPVFIIMEYADGGNLKDYLDSCRQALRQSGRTPVISSATSRECKAICNGEVKRDRVVWCREGLYVVSDCSG